MNLRRFATRLGALIVGMAACAAPAQTSRSVPDTMAQRALACTGCHGDQGRSRPDGYVPRLAGKPAGYLFAQLRAFRDGRRRNETMAALLAPLDDPMLAALAGHFAGLSVPYPPPAQALGSGPDTDRARRLVHEGDPGRRVPACTRCHGRALTGVAPAVPGLLGLPADYLVAQLGAWRTGHRVARDPDCMAEIARRLPAEDVARVARWLAAQPVPSQSEPATQPPGDWPLVCSGGDAAPAAPAAPSERPPAPSRAELIARGAYLATVGNCAGCHTAPGGAPMAGGVRLQTPYGAVYGGNLTPDPATGLGGWSADDFHRAMHEGRSRDGRRLVPAFPYTSFTRVARADNDALFAYLQSLAPVVQAATPHELRFPYGTQAALALWQWINFTPAAANARPPSEGLARGEYLVRGLGHCGECHAPRNGWSAPGEDLTGGEMTGARWYAPSLHPRRDDTAAAAAQTVKLLRDGIGPTGAVAGPMARVVLDSTQHWQPDDLAQAARYLDSLPRRPAPAQAPAADPAQLEAGGRIYADRCADCHGTAGRGVDGIYPALAGNPGVTQPSIRNLVRMLRHGGFPPSTAGNPRPYGMPPSELSDADAAAVLSFLRQSWGHQASAVGALDVLKAR